MTENKKKIIKIITILCVLFILIPFVIWFGVKIFEDRKYNLVSVIIAALSCVPFFVRFERGKSGAREMVVISVMTAFSVLGRLVFAPIPGFKPVTAMTVISGIALGGEAGFIVGGMSALVSNIFFGQGPWTPFQMFVWGLLGFLSGVVFRKTCRPNRLVLSLFGVLGGVLYSLLMDIWTTLSFDGTFLLSRYLANVAASLPFMAVYAVSNVIFLLLLARPFLEKLGRIKTKYGIFRTEDSEN